MHYGFLFIPIILTLMLVVGIIILTVALVNTIELANTHCEHTIFMPNPTNEPHGRLEEGYDSSMACEEEEEAGHIHSIDL